MAQQAPATSSEGAGFVKKIAKMGEVVWWSAALALAAVTLTLGNKWIMHDFHFPLTLLLVQNTTAAIVILITAMAMKLAGKSRMEPFTASQIIIVLGSAAVSTLQLAASLIALPHISIATLTVFGNGRCVRERESVGSSTARARAEPQSASSPPFASFSLTHSHFLPLSLSLSLSLSLHLSTSLLLLYSTPGR